MDYINKSELLSKLIRENSNSSPSPIELSDFTGMNLKKLIKGLDHYAKHFEMLINGKIIKLIPDDYIIKKGDTLTPLPNIYLL